MGFVEVDGLQELYIFFLNLYYLILKFIPDEVLQITTFVEVDCNFYLKYFACFLY